ncbi:uncharacterized protein LOC135209043 [Macrobrachium nipponense]|uniref:uncharacterized protein LOC135209043 n=1 Tax=Macrobrachium nipponense TaxID=159736 RepID=UPI0030C8B3D8
MVEAAVGIRMVASQLLLMNHFLMTLSHNTADLSSIHDINSVAVDPSECSYGCTLCSPINGCLACKPPFFLSLHREGVRQTATCTRSCPKGFYKLKKKRNGFCAKCTIRGCADCLDSRYCSTCEASFVNFFGKCIKHKSEEAREDLGMYTTTRRPAGDYIPSAGPWSPAKNNVTLLFSQLPLAVNTSGPPEDSLTTSSLPPTVTATPLSDVGATTEFIRRRSKTSKPGHMGAAPDLSTRFYFTTPTSPLLSGEPTSAISPYPTQSPVFPPPDSPCRVRGDRKPYGRPRTNRKERKERRGRKKDRDRKFRRRKGRRGKKNRRYGCKSRSKAKKDISSAPPSQDPAMRQKNSVSDGERRTGDPYPYHDVRPSEDAKVSLFDDSNSSALSDGGSATDLPHHFRNRPRDMVAYKTSLVVARRRSEARDEAETLYQNGRRLRHGRSRGILSDDEDAERNSSGKKIPQTKSARRRRRRRRRKRRKEERNVERRS